MIGFCVPARRFPSQLSLLVIFFTQRTALVCPSLGSRLRWHAFRSPLSFQCLSLAFGRLLLYLPTRVLTGSVTIGRGRQTR